MTEVLFVVIFMMCLETKETILIFKWTYLVMLSAWYPVSVGVDLEQSRKEEEEQMLQDARQWLNSGEIEDLRQARSGATALHVAAAKGYSEVLRYCPLTLTRSLLDWEKMSWVLEGGGDQIFNYGVFFICFLL